MPLRPYRDPVPPSVPLRHSLLVRLLTTSLLVALGSVLAASWLTIQTATRAIEQERGQALTDDLQIYNAMVDYATEHPQWDDVRWQVEKLAEQTGRRITLTTTNRQLITDSAGRPNAIAEVALRQASVVVDPLQVNRYLTSRFAGNQAEWNQIDPRILGPYRLTRVEKYVYQRIVYNLTTCMRPFGQAPVITYLTNGRPIVKSASSLDRGTPSTDASPIALCTKDLKPTAHETVALKRLNKLIKTVSSRRASRRSGSDPISPRWPVTSRSPSAGVHRFGPAPAAGQLRRTAGPALHG